MRAYKGLITVFLLAPLLLFFIPVLAAAEENRPQAASAYTAPYPLPTLSARAAILISAESGEIYSSKNADLRLPMASTTKIMTALLAIEAMPLDTVVSVAKEAVGVEGSSVYLYAGERLTLRSLLHALLLESANDAASAIACAVSGDTASFVVRMNEKAEELGLVDTHFMNPHGLFHEDHYTTAKELALITRAALEHEEFRTIVSTVKYSAPMLPPTGDGQAEGVSRLFINHNKLLRSYDGCIGVKTGFTKKSGRCLVSAAERDGLCLIAVTLDAGDDWNDHRKLLDYGFSRYESHLLAGMGEVSYRVPVYNSLVKELCIENREALSLPLPQEHGEITVRISLPHAIWETVTAGERLGEAVYYLDGKEIAVLPLYARESAEQISYSFSLLDFFLGLFRP